MSLGLVVALSAACSPAAGLILGVVIRVAQGRRVLP